MAIPSFLKKDNEAILFNEEGKELIYYVPESYFDSSEAIVVGEYVTLIGIFDYTIKDLKSNKNNGLHNFYFPSLFICKPNEIEKLKKVKLTSYSDVSDYRLLKFKKGNQAISSVKVPKAISNAELFFKMFIYSRIPNTVPYDKLQNYFIDNIHANGGDYGISIQLIGALIGEACRDKNNIEKRFRNTDIKNMHDYKLIPLLDLPKLISPFNSITSENWDKAVVNAIENKNNVYSPLEKLLML